MDWDELRWEGMGQGRMGWDVIGWDGVGWLEFDYLPAGDLLRKPWKYRTPRTGHLDLPLSKAATMDHNHTAKRTHSGPQRVYSKKRSEGMREGKVGGEELGHDVCL